MLTTDATVVKAAPALLWTIWTGEDSVVLLQSRTTWESHHRWSVSKLTLFDFLTQRCCQVHDQCYTDALQHPECWPILDNPYTEFYAYECNETTKQVSCTSECTLIFILIPGNIKVITFKGTLFSFGDYISLSPLFSSGANNECEMFICECDRKAAECFAKSAWNPEHEHLPSEMCE